jgi:hypothetical protein
LSFFFSIDFSILFWSICLKPGGPIKILTGCYGRFWFSEIKLFFYLHVFCEQYLNFIAQFLHVEKEETQTRFWTKKKEYKFLFLREAALSSFF